MADMWIRVHITGLKRSQRSNPRWLYISKYISWVVQTMCKISCFYQKVHNSLIFIEYAALLIVKEFPMRVKFDDERAIDAGGVARDMLSMFWEKTYMKMFDGGALLIPAVHHQVAMENFPTVGAILSHGYLVCGMLLARIAFPVLATCLLGPSTKICDKIIFYAFPCLAWWRGAKRSICRC